MIKKLFFLLLLFHFKTYTNFDADRTVLLHQEALSHTNPNISKETHPILYEMIEELVTMAGTSMPRYISIYPARFTMISTIADGHDIAHEITREILAYADIFDDLHICYEILTDLSYDEVKGILAIAVAEKVHKRVLKVTAMGAGTFGAFIALLYKQYDHLKKQAAAVNIPEKDLAPLIAGLTPLFLIPACIAAKILYNNLQKRIDFGAAAITNVQTVIDGIEALEKIEEAYSKENICSRIVGILGLKPFFKLLIYPLRLYTFEERIEYLQDAE